MAFLTINRSNTLTAASYNQTSSLALSLSSMTPTDISMLQANNNTISTDTSDPVALAGNNIAIAGIVVAAVIAIGIAVAGYIYKEMRQKKSAREAAERDGMSMV